MHVLLVLEQRAVEWRNDGLAIVSAQGLRGDVLRQQQLEPVQQFRGRRLLFQPRHLPDGEESLEGFLQQSLLDPRVVDLDDLLHGSLVGKTDVVEEAAAQKGVRQVFLIVAGNEDQRPLLRFDELPGLVDVELHPVQLPQQVVGELDVGLIDLVDEEHHRRLAHEGLPEHPGHDVVGDVLHLRVTKLGIPQPRHRVILIEALLGFSGGLDVPLQQRHAQTPGHLLGEAGLAGAGLAFDE